MKRSKPSLQKKKGHYYSNVATLSLRFGAGKENFADFATSIVIDSKVDLHDNVCIEANDNMPTHTFAQSSTHSGLLGNVPVVICSCFFTMQDLEP